jgi:hypothetical protein
MQAGRVQGSCGNVIVNSCIDRGSMSIVDILRRCAVHCFGVPTT